MHTRGAVKQRFESTVHQAVQRFESIWTVWSDNLGPGRNVASGRRARLLESAMKEREVAAEQIQFGLKRRDLVCGIGS
jgi:hypothetical protein